MYNAHIIIFQYYWDMQFLLQLTDNARASEKKNITFIVKYGNNYLNDKKIIFFRSKIIYQLTIEVVTLV